MKILSEIKKDKTGYGLLIEKDAGFIDGSDERNKIAINELNSIITNENGIEIKDRLKVFAVFQKYGIENANGRIYPENILRKEVDNYRVRIKERRSYGELNHPESITLDGDRLAFGITDLWWDKHTLVGEMELILSPGFVKYGIISCVGDKVANYLRLGWKIGVSSRGLGSVEKDFSGKYIVQDDFEITCWDIVTDGSTPGSWIDKSPNELQQYVESKPTNTKKNRMIENIDKFLDNNNKVILK